jgi:hypothetical protein
MTRYFNAYANQLQQYKNEISVANVTAVPLKCTQMRFIEAMRMKSTYNRQTSADTQTIKRLLDRNIDPPS